MKNKILYALLSLVIAFGLWAYVITVVSPESEDTFYNVPVVFNNESILRDNGLMITSGSNSTVTLKLKGNRSDLNDLKVSDITVLADLASIDREGDTQLSYTVNFPGNISFEILDQNPKRVFLSVTQWATKEVDVKVGYTGAIAADYVADTENVELDHQKVTLTGPKSVIDQITQAVIPVDLTGHSQTINQSYRFTLCNAEGVPVDASQVQASVAEVQLTLRILRVKEVELLLDVTYGGGATAATTQIKLDPQTIKVAGSEKLLEGLDTLTVGTVNLADILEDTVQTYSINLPEGVDNISGTDEVSASIEFKGLKTKKIKVTRITAVGDANAQITLARKDLEITVRGPAELIDRLTEDDVSIVVDCKGAAAGEGIFKAQVKFGAGFESLGAVGNYPVHASIRFK